MLEKLTKTVLTLVISLTLLLGEFCSVVRAEDGGRMIITGDRIKKCGPGTIRVTEGDSVSCVLLSDSGVFLSSISAFPTGGGSFSSSSTETSDPDSDPDDECKGNPIMVGSGNKIQYETDYIGKGEFPLKIERNYSHFSEHEDFFGEHWISNFGSYLDISANTIAAYRADGRVINFSKLHTNGIVWVDRKGAASTNLIHQNADGTFTFNTEDNFVEQYNSDGQLQSVTNSESISHTYTYQNDLINQITHSSGDTLTFNWSQGRLTKITDVAGNHYNYSYTNNMLSQVVRPGLPVVTKDYLYQNSKYPKALTQININGEKYATFTYHTDGKGKSTNHWITTTDGFFTTESEVDKFEFNYSSNYTTVTNPLGHQERYIYSNVNGVRKVTAIQRLSAPSCPAANSGTTYDSNGMIKTTTDWKGIVTEHNYNASGQLQSQVYAKNTEEEETVTYTWVAGENRIQKQVTNDLEVTYSYTGSGRIDEVSTRNLSSFGNFNETRTTDYSYTNHSNGILATMTINGPRTDVNDIFTYQYDTSGNLIKITNSLGHETNYSHYDLLGNVGKITTSNGLVFDFTYDAASKLISQKIHHPAGIQTTSYEYNAMGQPLKVTYPGGNYLEYEYDQAYRLIQVNDRYNHYIKYELNENGDTISQKIGEEGIRYELPPQCRGGSKDDSITNGDPTDCRPVPTPFNNMSYSKYFDYDVMGRIQAQTGNGGQRTDFDYDNNSNIKEVMDSYGRKTIYSHDGLNRVKTVTDPKGGITSFSYDSGGRIKTLTDARGLVTTYHYSGFGELAQLISPDTGTTSYSYNKSGQIEEMIRNDGVISSFAYDVLGRIISESHNSTTKSYSYDTGSNRKGRLYNVSDSSGETEYHYDKVGNIIQKSSTINSTVFNTYYTYDGMNRVTSMTYPSGRVALYSYNSMGQVSRVRYQQGTSKKNVASELQYRSFGPLYRMKFGNGDVREITHDLDYRPTQIKTAETQNLSYSFDKNNNIKRITNSVVSANTQTYGYDELNRLTDSSSSATGNIEYHYDSVGNRLNRYKNGTLQETLNYASNSNQLTSVNGSSITYNDNGHTKTKGGAIFNYNSENRLSSHFKSPTVTRFSYNALGQRVYKSGGSTGNHYYLYDEVGQLIAEKSGSTWKEYIYLYGQVVGYAINGDLYYVYNDHLGRAEKITNASRSTVWSADNFDFDRSIRLDLIDGYNLGFPGQYWDEETELYYNYFRDYDPKIGRYVQSDPIGLAGGVNTYGYVSGNPVNRFDPFGLKECGCKSAWQNWKDEFKSNWNTTSGMIDDANPVPAINPQTAINFGLGGMAARSYGGSTPLQETARYISNRFRAPASQFRLYPRFDFARVGMTTAIQGIAVNAAWYTGRSIGNALYTTYNQAMYGGQSCE